MNSAIFWNIRGIGNGASKRSLKQLVVKYHPSLVAVFEPKQSLDKASIVSFSIKLDNFDYSSGQDPKIWISAKNKHPILVKWIPQIVSNSLNVDGASKGNPSICGGGGCIRDSHGNFIHGFAFFYGFGSSTLAKARAIHDGLRLAIECKLHISVVYSDSAVLRKAISSGRPPHWVVFPWWRSITHMIHILKPNMLHTFREGNQVADALANFACFNRSSSVFLDARSLPFQARGALLVDKAAVVLEFGCILFYFFWRLIFWCRDMASRGRRGVPAREGEQRRDEPQREDQGEQQAPAPQGPVLPPPPLVDYGVFMQGLVQAMQTQAHTQAALQAQLEAQAQVPAPQADHGGPSIMERFKRMSPPSFKGESDPLLVESWMREIEKIFRTIRCTEDDKVCETPKFFVIL
ncbi:hypothetical protein Taro_010148 [Colocasia esculenta]|uniref:RNase H type-1 domain-containing protein n=1 Tax=Colocasia esculenta TaxID=4460 RepID=A0A843U2G6_COLES|nr:hypothetical protein [Colocasia esculenta]